MSPLRSLLLRASRSRWLAGQFRRRKFARRAVSRFMPGEHAPAALDAAESFGAIGIGTILTHLGEQVRDVEAARGVRDHYLDLLEAVRARALPADLSVKLTHLGLDLDGDLCEESLRALVARAGETGAFVWVDMEESWYVDRTLDLFRRVRKESDRVGLCLQAYLRRTPEDLESLLPLAPAIRLVKGAYREPDEIAFARKRDTDAAYLALAERILACAGGGALPVLGTHDLPLIERVRERAAAFGLPASSFEVHMLYGIAGRAQRRLADRGTTVRVLISYGEEWFPWYVRRIAERPANLWFVAKNLIS